MKARLNVVNSIFRSDARSACSVSALRPLLGSMSAIQAFRLQASEAITMYAQLLASVFTGAMREIESRLLAKIVPRGADGTPAPVAEGGRIGLVFIGMSNTSQHWSSFQNLMADHPQRAPEVVLVNGALGSNDVRSWGSDDASDPWQHLDQQLTAAGISAQQVQVLAPLLRWGPYLWAYGVQARADGVAWPREFFVADGVHPTAAGPAQVADLLRDYYLSDSSTQWFRQ